jgi:hypothetical protein
MLFKNGSKDMRYDRWKSGIGILFFLGALSGVGFAAPHHEQEGILESKPGSGKVFCYTAKKFGIPMLKASIKIENGSYKEGRLLYQIHASVETLHLGFVFRMKNRFFSTMDAETCSPIQYAKEIDQEGFIVGKKNYVQTFTFDLSNKRVVAEKGENNERQEFPLLCETYDPLSMFAKCYLKGDIHPGQNIPMSIFDGIKLRQMVFYSKKGKVKSKMYGPVETVCLESSTPFSSFEDKEGKIRIWYTANGEKVPILIDLELPVGRIKFELDSVERN